MQIIASRIRSGDADIMLAGVKALRALFRSEPRATTEAASFGLTADVEKLLQASASVEKLCSKAWFFPQRVTKSFVCVIGHSSVHIAWPHVPFALAAPQSTECASGHLSAVRWTITCLLKPLFYGSTFWHLCVLAQCIVPDIGYWVHLCGSLQNRR